MKSSMVDRMTSRGVEDGRTARRLRSGVHVMGAALGRWLRALVVLLRPRCLSLETRANRDSPAPRKALCRGLQKFGRGAWMLVIVVPGVVTGTAAAQNKIAFETDRDGNGEIYVMDADGTNQINLTLDPDNDQAPSWSLDYTKIVFDSFRDGNREIYVMDADGTNQTRLTTDLATDAEPGWSPNGDKIVFESFRDGDYEIYVMDANGSNQTNLTKNPAANDLMPDWSPDGSKILFQTNRDGNFEIYVMDADGTNPTNLTTNPANDYEPAWSPDGTKIAFHSLRDGNLEIYVMDADGTNQINRTNHAGGDDNSATWSGDGGQIAFATNRGGDYEIYVMDANGSNQINRTNDAGGDDKEPSWQRIWLMLLDHDPPGQESDAFTDAGGVADAELFGFKLDPGPDTISVTQLVFSLSDIANLADLDWVLVEVAVDDNGDGTIGVGETTAVGGGGTVLGSTITFASSFSVSSATNYILRADFPTLANCAKVTIALNAADVQTTTTVSGSTTSASHVEGTGCITQTFYYITPVEKTPASAGWSNVDVSGEVPAGATGAIVHWMADTQTGMDIGLRKPAATPDTRFGTIASDGHLWAMAGLDGARSFDAYISDATNLHLWVVGYTTAGVTFFDNAIAKSLSSKNIWVPIDISGDTNSDTAIGAIIEVQTGSWMRKFGLQMNGSNDDRFEIARQCWAVVGVDGLEKLEGYRTHNQVKFWLVGYITEGATFFLDAKDISLTSAGPVNPFQEIDITAHTTKLANGAFIQSFTTFSSKYGLQPKGLSENALKKISSGSAAGHAWGIIEVDGNEVLEAQIDNISHDFFLVGYSHGGGSWMATGSYTGNSPSSQSITGVGFQPDVVFVKKYPANKYGYVRTSTMSGGLSKKIHYANPLEADQIQTLDPDGFTVGSGLDVNASGDTGYWIAFRSATGTLKVGTYPGTGVIQSISGVGFKPNVVMVFPDGGTDVSCFRTSTMPDDTSAKFDTAPNGQLSNGSNWIKLLESDGFQVGTNAKVNKSGITYHYLAFKTTAGQVEVGSYTGDGSNDHDIPVSFKPKYVIVYGDDPGLITPGGSHAIIHRPDSMVGNTSLNMSWGYAADTFVDTIQALEPTGFQVGSDITVNQFATTYHWMAFGASASAGPPPKPKIIKWVEVDPYGP